MCLCVYVIVCVIFFHVFFKLLPATSTSVTASATRAMTTITTRAMTKSGTHQVMLYASELAALTGRNKYKGRASAAVEVWRRTNRVSFENALARAGITYRSDRDTVRHIGLEVAVADAGRANTEQEATDAAEVLMGEPLVQYCGGVSKGGGGKGCGNGEGACEGAGEGAGEKGAGEGEGEGEGAMRALIASICTAGSPSAKVASFVRSVEHMSGGPLLAAAKCTLASRAAILMTKVVPAGATEPLRAADIARDVQSIVATVRVRDCPTAARAVQGAVNMARGIAHEAGAVEAYAELCGAQVQERNTHFYRKNIGSKDAPCWIGGRVDGLREDRVVEVKCRRNRFFSFLPLYENVQIHAYMVLTGHAMCDVVQKYGHSVRTETHHFDDIFWNGVREDAMCCSQRLNDALENSQLQDQLLREFAQDSPR